MFRATANTAMPSKPGANPPPVLDDDGDPFAQPGSQIRGEPARAEQDVVAIISMPKREPSFILFGKLSDKLAVLLSCQWLQLGQGA